MDMDVCLFFGEGSAATFTGICIESAQFRGGGGGSALVDNALDNSRMHTMGLGKVFGGQDPTPAPAC
jgi:hypothetical protein